MDTALHIDHHMVLCSHCPVLLVSLMSYHRILNKSNTAGATCGAGTVYHSVAPGFVHPLFYWDLYCAIIRSLCSVFLIMVSHNVLPFYGFMFLHICLSLYCMQVSMLDIFKCQEKFEAKMSCHYINAREYRRGNQSWTIQRNWQHRVQKTKNFKAKTQHNMCWTPLYIYSLTFI